MDYKEYIEELKRKIEREQNGEVEEKTIIDTEMYNHIKEMIEIDFIKDECKELELEELIELDEKLAQQERELLAKEIVRQQSLEVDKLYTKEDIMKKFHCESDKALKILRLAYEMRYAIKIGKEYYISQEDFSAFITHNRWRNVTL